MSRRATSEWGWGRSKTNLKTFPWHGCLREALPPWHLHASIISFIFLPSTRFNWIIKYWGCFRHMCSLSCQLKRTNVVIVFAALTSSRAHWLCQLFMPCKMHIKADKHQFRHFRELAAPQRRPQMKLSYVYGARVLRLGGGGRPLSRPKVHTKVEKSANSHKSPTELRRVGGQP